MNMVVLRQYYGSVSSRRMWGLFLGWLFLLGVSLGFPGMPPTTTTLLHHRHSLIIRQHPPVISVGHLPRISIDCYCNKRLFSNDVALGAARRLDPLDAWEGSAEDSNEDDALVVTNTTFTTTLQTRRRTTIFQLLRTVWRRSLRHVHQLWGRVRGFWNRRIRSQFCTIYVLECEDDKYYVGMTFDRQRRFRQHFSSSASGGGSAWTRQHKPLCVHKEYRRIPRRFALGFESQITAQYMWSYGIQNVRGGMYAQRRPFTNGDLDGLVRFLGHYNSLPYQTVRNKLLLLLAPPTKTIYPRQQQQQQGSNKGPLPSSTATASRLELAMASFSTPSSSVLGRKCYQCGDYGHLAVDCPRSVGISRKKCRQCGNYGHLMADCPNSTREENTTTPSV